MSEKELRAIAEVLERHPHVYVLSDDIYEHIRYSNEAYFTIAQASDALKDRTLTANGVSKSWCMTGWRIGFAAGPKPLIDAMRVYQGQSTGGVMHPAQYGAVEALNGPRDFMADNLAQFRRRRDLGVDLINGTDGLSCHAPDGAFLSVRLLQGPDERENSKWGHHQDRWRSDPVFYRRGRSRLCPGSRFRNVSLLSNFIRLPHRRP